MPDRRRTRIATLARHEFRSASRSRMLLTLLAILITATIASVYIGAADYRSQLADYRAYVSQAAAAGVQRIAPSPLALLSLLRGAFEYIEIIGAVIAITLGYLSVARERSNRTLPLLRTRPVTPGELAAGSALGALGIITILVTVAGLVAIVCLGVIGNDWVNGTQALKLLLGYSAAVVYMMVFWLVGVIATAKSKTPANGLMIALAIWLVVVLIIPQIGDTLDADNQIPGGLFASLGLGRDGETQVLNHFGAYEQIRTTIEATSFAKHFERFAFAMTDVKAKYRDLSLGALLDLKRIELIWMAATTTVLGAWLRRVLRLQPSVPQGGPS